MMRKMFEVESQCEVEIVILDQPIKCHTSYDLHYFLTFHIRFVRVWFPYTPPLGFPTNHRVYKYKFDFKISHNKNIYVTAIQTN